MGWLNRNLLSQLWQLEAWNQGISKAVLPPKPARNPSLHLSSCWLLAVLGAPWFAAAPLPPPPLCSQDALCVISALSFIIPFLFLLWVYITLLFLTPWDGSLEYLFETFFFLSNVGIQWYKFHSGLLYLGSTYFDILYFQFHSVKYSFKFLLAPCLWPVDYLEVCCLVSKCLENVLLSFCYWFLVWFIAVGEYTVVDINSYTLVCAPRAIEKVVCSAILGWSVL